MYSAWTSTSMSTSRSTSASTSTSASASASASTSTSESGSSSSSNRRTSAVPGMVSSLPCNARHAWRATFSGLQIAVHEVDLLQPAKALADVLGTDLADPLDCLELGVTRGEQFVEPAEGMNDVRDDQLRQARDAAEDAIAARRHRVVERVELAIVAEQLGETSEVEQVLVPEATDRVEHGGELLVAVARYVVVHERGLLGRGAEHRLLEVH